MMKKLKYKHKCEPSEFVQLLSMKNKTAVEVCRKAAVRKSYQTKFSMTHTYASSTCFKRLFSLKRAPTCVRTWTPKSHI